VAVARTDGIYVKGRTCNVSMEWLIDTGSNVTIISEKVFCTIPTADRPVLKPFGETLSTADGSPLGVLGEATFPIHVGGLQVNQTVLVARFTIQGILGMDFLESNGICLDLARGTVRHEGGEIPTLQRNHHCHCCRITVAETVTVRAGHRVIVEGKLPKVIPKGDWLVEPLTKPIGGRPLMVARALIRGGDQRIPIEVMNPTSEDVILYRKTNAALLQPVELSTDIEPIPVGEEGKPIPQGMKSTVHQISTEKLKPELQKLLDEIQYPLSATEKDAVKQMLCRNQKAFQCEGEPLGRTDIVKHDIITTTDRPIKQKPRRFPIHQRDEGNKIVEEMLGADVIEPSSSPWTSPVVLVKKKDGSTRFCVDYRKLNEISVKDAYPLPRIDESLDALSGAQCFSTLDLASGYWQVGMTEDAKQKSAFATPSGFYQFKCMPFGLSNAPSTFERLMEKVLVGLQWQVCLIYLDDIIIYSRSCVEHVSRLEEVLKRIAGAGLKLKPKKCHFFCKEVLYLGHVVSAEGISTDPAKVQAVQDWGVPRDLTDVRSFLGLCSYYRRFIPKFSTIAKPLTKLTEKNVGFMWGTDQEEAWLELKQKLLTAPILAYPDPTREFIVDTDASAYGIGAVLSQVQDGAERVIAYGSRSLTKEERHYCVTRKEMLAVVFYLKHFRHYLYGRKFTVRTDHGALRWLTNFKDPQGQVARWLEVLGTYDFEIQHRPGLRHNNADALSRGPCRQCGLDDTNHEPTQCLVTTRSQTRQAEESGQTESTPAEQPWIGEGPLSKDNLLKAQHGDPILSQVIAWKKAGLRPSWEQISAEGTILKTYWAQWNSLCFHQELLCRKLCLKGKNTRMQILVPSSSKDLVLENCHNAVTAGHMGIRRTLASVRRRFFWPRLRRDIQQWIGSCAVCASRKPTLRKRRGPMQDYRVGEPLERIALDISGPWPISHNGNRYILVVSDYLTRWSEAYPIPDQEARTIAETLVSEFVARYGVPRIIHSDQGRNFESRLFKEMCGLLGVKKTRTTTFHPQSNGLVERMNKTIGTLITSYVSENQKTWDKDLSLLMMAYRATPHETSGISPNELMLGREVSMPIDVQVGLPPESKPTEEIQYVENLRVRLENAYSLARENLEVGAERQKRRYDVGTSTLKYASGDLVWLLNQSRRKGRCPKLQKKWLGPMIVEAVLNDVTLKLRVNQSDTKVVHYDKVKPYEAREIPRWIIPIQDRLRGPSLDNQA